MKKYHDGGVKLPWICFLADSSVQAQLEAMICPSGAPTTGDRGNPYYAAELDKSKGDSEDFIWMA